VYPYVSTTHAENPSGDYGSWKTLTLRFKNGCPTDNHSFRELTNRIADEFAKCPVMDESPIAVPIPRSGDSEEPHCDDPHPFPSWALAQELESRGLASQAFQVLDREQSHEPHSSGGDRKIAKEFNTLTGDACAENLDGPVLMIDDNITTGTTAMASYFTLRQLGYDGKIVGAFVSQTPPPDPPSLSKKPCTMHRVHFEKDDSRAYHDYEDRWSDEDVWSL
jgi:hypothetical protein